VFGDGRLWRQQGGGGGSGGSAVEMVLDGGLDVGDRRGHVLVVQMVVVVRNRRQWL